MVSMFRSTSPGALQTGGGNRGPYPPQESGGGGGGGRGDGDSAHNPSERLRRYRMGLVFTIASITMLFVSFTTLFAARKMAGGKYDPVTHAFERDWTPLELPTTILLINTAILGLSSLTAERARRSAILETILVPASSIPGVRPIAQASLRWIRASATLGLMFLGGQYAAWEKIRSAGNPPSSGPSATFFYLLSGAHAVHLAGGLAVLLYAGFALGAPKTVMARRITTDVVAWYWHFMGLMWIYVLVVLYVLE